MALDTSGIQQAHSPLLSVCMVYLHKPAEDPMHVRARFTDASGTRWERTNHEPLKAIPSDRCCRRWVPEPSFRCNQEKSFSSPRPSSRLA